jgi:hypothetical protein
MFDSTSRYYKLNTSTINLTNSDGTTRTVRYVQRRIIPPVGSALTVIEHTITEGDRIDNITARYLGDPTAYWLICDANNVIHPSDLTDTPGRVIEIVLPQI